MGAIEGRGWSVVEANLAWAWGLCGADPAEVLAVLRGCVVAAQPTPPRRRSAASSGPRAAAGEAARWLRPRASVTP
ncbi:hypothetical protein [Nannocystis pusilla]|uniref:hypothetical protein n=1 Tax=Nannocystis pusilla TaxID=889268 RepID=UPI003DA6B94C